MGTLVGHVLPGFAFLAVGLWHLFNTIKLFCINHNTFTSSPWFPTSKLRYMELYFIMFFTSGFITIEFLVEQILLARYFEHCSIAMSFLVYAVLALVLDRSPASKGLTSLVFACAFTQQLFLFHFHSTDHMGVEGHYHLILQLITFVSILTTLIGIALPKSFVVHLVKSSSINFQGVWFIVIGYMLYIPSLIPKGCAIHDEDKSTHVKCSTVEALHRAKSLINIQFSGLFIINTIFVVTLYLILDRLYGEKREYSSLTTDYQTEQDDEEQQPISLKLTR